MPKEFFFTADFRQLPAFILPTQTLENRIFEKISANSRILSVTILLNQIIYSLAAIYNQTNDCIVFSELLCRKLTNYGEKLKSKGNFHNLKISYFGDLMNARLKQPIRS